MAFKDEAHGGKIKPAGYTTEFTNEQLIELDKCANDAIYFIENYCWIRSTRGFMKFSLYPYQRRLISHYCKYRKSITLIGRQSGKALWENTPILTPTGYKTMGALKVGDKVIGDDGKPTTITFATDLMYNHECYKITFDTDEIIADAEHMWNVCVRRNKKIDRITTRELIPLLEQYKKIGQPVYIPAADPIVYETAALPIDPPKNNRHYIRKIEAVESVPVRCIKVDNESHLFLCGNSLIPTHNTESAAAFLLWWAIFKEHQGILIASYKAEAAKAIMKRLKLMYEELPWWLKPGIKLPSGWNVMSVEFDNGSNVIADTTTENTGRGMAVNLFYLDEFAYVHPSITDAFWTSIYPIITSSDTCRCIVTSTANTDEDKFARIWFNSLDSDYTTDTTATKRVRPPPTDEELYETLYESEETIKEITPEELEEDSVHGFYGFFSDWTEVPGHDERFKQDTLAAGYTETEWLRDYECKFVTKDETLVSPIKLLSLNSCVRKPRFIDRWACRWYEEIYANKSYGVILDPSEGVGRDDACIQVIQFPDMIQVAEWNSNTADQAEQSKMLYRIIRRISKIQRNDPDYDGSCTIYYSVECNGIGLGILTALEIEYEHKIPAWLIDSEGNKLRGIRMTSAIKKNRALDMAALIERNIFIPRSRHLVSQLKTFVRKREGVYAAKQGSKDDIVMSVILMMQLIEELRVQDSEIQEKLLVDITGNYSTEEDEELYGPLNKPFVIIN
jgi:Terminase large subunit, T4likevirus-type, N-terminal